MGAYLGLLDLMACFLATEYGGRGPAGLSTGALAPGEGEGGTQVRSTGFHTQELWALKVQKLQELSIQPQLARQCTE